MKTISTGLVSCALILLFEAKKTTSNLDKLLQLRIINRVDVNAVIDFSTKMNWIFVQNQVIEITAIGDKLLMLFDGRNISVELWRLILSEYISYYSPVWSKRIPYGRKESFIFMSSDEKRCFLEAELMNNPVENSAVEWWDQISIQLRGYKQGSLIETGREGEKLTIDYEFERIGSIPRWESVESNLAGFDILSKVSRQSTNKLLIEVKTSKIRLDNSRMVITRNEWETSNNLAQNISYKFYVWLLGDNKCLAILNPIDILPHIPNEIGFGEWREIEIPFKVFEDKFHEIV